MDYLQITFVIVAAAGLTAYFVYSSITSDRDLDRLNREISDAIDKNLGRVVERDKQRRLKKFEDELRKP